ncbi:tRNA-uridine aminocarboxypropyltransferase 2-like isoform X1 [Ornithodoros turicata]|uniref:tRNA-uridine aminocarboxypropyltransferase 2-like isoform X1 n=1 Tax=Ornithodoros turicata TaxID=34597 RepID=UPI003139E7E5
MSDHDISAFFNELSNITADLPCKRELCAKCRRPVAVCWCAYLPSSPLQVACKVIILQHPGEVKRNLRTAPMLEAALAADKCVTFRGRRFSWERQGAFQDTVSGSLRDTLVLYPGPDAQDIETLPTVVERSGCGYNLIVLDGTWSQARSLFFNSPQLHGLKQVQINPNKTSDYVIRTQPTQECLSTVETVAYALSVLEDKPELQEVLTRPLHALCQFQLQHGAVTHHSKEFLIQNGMYKKPLPRRIVHRLARNEDLKDALR